MDDALAITAIPLTRLAIPRAHASPTLHHSIPFAADASFLLLQRTPDHHVATFGDAITYGAGARAIQGDSDPYTSYSFAPTYASSG